MRLLITIIISTLLFGQLSGQSKLDSLKREIELFFFDLPTNGSFDLLKNKLLINSNFKEIKSKTYDTNTTLTGQIIKGKNLNPGTVSNQLIVSVRNDQVSTRNTLRFGWYIQYRLDDLNIATEDRNKLISKFSTLFSECTEKSKEGYHGEINEYFDCKNKNVDLEIRLTKYERPGHHRLSIIYTEVRE